MLKARINSKRIEAGCDEVGRGCLAGPVVAAAVILPPRFKHEKLNDSKTLSEKTRLELTKLIKENALAWAVSFVEPVIIDRINILNASFLAMERAVKRLKIRPEHLLIDGNRFKSNLDIDFTCIIKGDSKNGSIAAASILAKTYRDEYMKSLHEEYPEYVWNKNVGYPTKAHRDAIRKLGPTSHHRKSFKLLPDQLVLELID
ncbi:ribonuclease HII [Salibacteraceae bacterium]|jgi:ribonuclease HII|nr:ribonuclease HII [Salibacteraceae bacterium]MDB4104028.1 ribonuclease HII [Salibacteraceae bacterium]MDB9709234.1 ribonuclease HII [Salibacteraceae bacterium]MDC1304597.1 ribonuclease HII [Salibacteraceae bacterium]HAQ71976.1 ribonuclease HII [Flavobacteriales bacterium]